MRSDQASRQGFWCSTTGDSPPRDTRSGPIAAPCRARLGTPQYHPVAAAGWRGGGRRRLSVLCPVSCRLAGEPRLLRPRCDLPGLAITRFLRAAAAGPTLGNFELGPSLDDADPNPTGRTPGANRSLPLAPPPELPVGHRGDRCAAARLRGRPDRGVIFDRQLDADRPAHSDRGKGSRTTARAVRFPA